jgi:hypothetical protein
MTRCSTLCLGKVAYQLLALVDILEGVHAGLPRPSDMADREEGRKPYDRATDVLATIECVLEDELRPAIISLQRSAPRQPAADHEGDRPADRDPVRDGAPGRGADPGRDEGDEDGTLPPARRPLVSRKDAVRLAQGSRQGGGARRPGLQLQAGGWGRADPDD